MARNNELLVPQAEPALEQLKMETAQELGLLHKVNQVGWENMTTREVGMIGGHMVKKMINAAEAALTEEAVRLQTDQFRATLKQQDDLESKGVSGEGAPKPNPSSQPSSVGYRPRQTYTDPEEAEYEEWR